MPAFPSGQGLSAWSFAENSGESGRRETLASLCSQGVFICRVVFTREDHSWLASKCQAEKLTRIDRNRGVLALFGERLQGIMATSR